MQAVMIGPSKQNPEGVHYGKIPGTPKPTLYKAGAEVLCATFRIAPSYRIEDLSTDDYIRYRVACVGTHQTSGAVLGEGMGECSSNEEKYKWRKAGKKEFDATPENRRRIKYGKDYETFQVRTEPADIANTVLKMACKRAQVAMSLNTTAASDIFSQDIEDLPEELRPSEDEKTVKQEPKGPVMYPSEQYAKNLPTWTKLISEGKKTADAVITQVEMKGLLTDEQKKELRGIKVAVPVEQEEEIVS
jgi:hypothetical protein